MNQYTKIIGRRVRRSETAEYFTPEEWVNKYIEHYDLDKKEGACFIDPTGGSGIWLKRLFKNDKPVFYIDIVPANCIEAILNLYKDSDIKLCPKDKIPKSYSSQEGFKEMYMLDNKVILNIVCADSTRFSYEKIFGWEKPLVFGNNLFSM